MNKKAVKRSTIVAVIWILLALLALTGATYAWFTFTTWTKVTPISGTINDEGIQLLIANNYAGPFDRTTELIFSRDIDRLQPVTTANLGSFYVPSGQDSSGVPTGYRDVTASADEFLIHGTLYLESLDAGCRVYMHRDGCYFGNDIQAMAAMRLGLRVTTINEGVQTFIFRLDDFIDTSSALARNTVITPGTVYGGSYVNDPAISMQGFFAGGNDEDPTPGERMLCTLNADEIGTVEYWFWLEGCDIHCYNPVQSRDLGIQFGFAGVE